MGTRKGLKTGSSSRSRTEARSGPGTGTGILGGGKCLEPGVNRKLIQTLNWKPGLISGTGTELRPGTGTGTGTGFFL